MAIMKKDVEIKIFPDPAEVFKSAAADFSQRAIAAIQRQGVFNVVLSGGNTATFFFDSLVECYKDQIPWGQIQFFFGDERYVPADDVQSNYHMAYEHLFSKVAVPKENIHRIPTGLNDPNAAAEEYEHSLRKLFNTQNTEFPKFDLLYLGLGENAHTASLMPLSDVVKDAAKNLSGSQNPRLVASLLVPELNMYRITLTPNAINNSSCIIFLVTGESKAPAVYEVLEGPIAPEQYPAQLIHCLYGKTIWYLDHAAAKKLNVCHPMD
ncbi:MAG: 6-phosphogluconolactonase [Gammaproteobacteria bacterium]